MKKRLLSTLLVLCIVLVWMPGIALADGGITILTDEDGTEHYLSPDSWMQRGPTSGNGWSWDADAQILTLSEYKGESINCGNVQKIVLADGSHNTLEEIFLFCAYNNESLTIEGTGELVIHSTREKNYTHGGHPATPEKIPALSASLPDGPLIFSGTLEMTGGMNEGDSSPLTLVEHAATKVISGGTYATTSSGEKATYVRIAPSNSASEITTPPAKEEPTPADNASLTATPTASTVLVNGEETAFDAYNIADNNYFKLRDLAYVLNGSDKQFEVTWDAASNAIALTSGNAYTTVGGEMTSKGEGSQTAAPTTSRIMLDGTEISLTAYQIGGNNYFKLRDIGEAFDFGVDWDASAKTIRIDTSKAYTPD